MPVAATGICVEAGRSAISGSYSRALAATETPRRPIVVGFTPQPDQPLLGHLAWQLGGKRCPLPSTSNLYRTGGLLQAPVVPHNRPPRDRAYEMES